LCFLSWRILHRRRDKSAPSSRSRLWRPSSTTRDGILRHQFNKRLESFAPCYSQSLLLADFYKKPYSTLVLIIITKKSANSEMNSIL
jgi:hypothetical protein